MSGAASGNRFWEQLWNPSRRTDWARAGRATAGFMVPLALQATVGLPVSVVFASIAAQNIAMLDVRGDYRLRVLLLVGMTRLLASAGALGALAAAISRVRWWRRCWWRWGRRCGGTWAVTTARCCRRRRCCCS
ncbi:MAG: hypothetical protein J6386_13540 [Candidatus Synoicihabitans palmerolidicus]|nr:hypothetical protein [Candidatus Synoicihabitans palmerolidicus]